MPYPTRLTQTAATLLAVLVVCIPMMAGPPDPLDQLLARTADVLEHFLQQISEVECTELVAQDKLAKNNKVEYKENSTFDYVLLAQSNGGEPTLLESRLQKQESKHKQDLPLMVTNGFSTLLLVFHPYYRPSFDFTSLGDEELSGKLYTRVQFRHIKGLRTTAALLLRGREYPLDLQGVAWIDKEAGTVLRITAGLETPMDDIGLHVLQADVLYAPVIFQGLQQVYWVPSKAVIDVESPRQHWRNVHQFTAYHRFSTSVETRLAQQP